MALHDANDARQELTRKTKHTSGRLNDVPPSPSVVKRVINLRENSVTRPKSRNGARPSSA